MKISILLYDGLAPLDAIGPFEVFNNVPGWEVEFVGLRRGELRSGSDVESGRRALGLVADLAIEEVAETDLLLLPGGRGNRPLLGDERLLEWLRAIDRTTRWTTSVCTGALLLGAAGLLRGRRATTNWLALDSLPGYGAEAVGGRYVLDGGLATAAGVTAGIDMALELVSREVSPEVAQAVQLGIEYDPQPPFDCGSPEKAPARIVELVTRVAAAAEAGEPRPPSAAD